jgi:hypothetical protein
MTEKTALAAPKPMVSLRLSPTGSPRLWNRPGVLKNTLAKKARMLVEVGILAKT